MMKAITAASILIAISVLSMLSHPSWSATIWTGPSLTFAKAAFADPTDPANQDRLTDNVWITRGGAQGIFNIAQEASFSGTGFGSPSPLDTEWAVGTTADLDSLTFETWVEAIDQNPPAAVFYAQDFVLHLITDDIFIDLRFVEWGQYAGGSFSYVRSTPVPEPGTVGLALVASLAGWLTLVRGKRPRADGSRWMGTA